MKSLGRILISNLKGSIAAFLYGGIYMKVTLERYLGHENEAQVVKIYKKVGDSIETGDVLIEVEGNKAAIPIIPGVKGIIESIYVNEGDIITKDSVIAIIKEDYSNKDTKEIKTKSEENFAFDYFATILKPKEEELKCDIAIIGGGPGGYVAAIYAAQNGKNVVLIEKDKLGGTCLNRGCIPTKALVRSAEVYKIIKNADKFGCLLQNPSVDIKKVIERKNKVVNELNSGIKYLMKKNNVTVLEGLGSFVDKETIHVKGNSREYIVKAQNIIIATGSKPYIPQIEGINEINNNNIITSDEALEIKDLSKKMIIIGGGVIGMEFAFIFANFGVDVSIIEYFDNCLANLDDDVIAEISRNAIEKGIKIYTGSKVEEVYKTEDNELIVGFLQKGERKYLRGDKILLAVGRKPYIDELGIEKLGIELNDNKRGIKVNSKMQTNISNIYAIGDVTDRILLAHVASHQGIVAVDNILGKEKEMDYANVPSAIFTEPEIATVGINEREAISKGIEIKVSKIPFASNGKALTYGDNRGFIKLIEDIHNKKIIGATIIGIHATDLIANITLAIKKNLCPEDIIETIYAHPTTSEIIHEAALGLEKGAIHFA